MLFRFQVKVVVTSGLPYFVGILSACTAPNHLGNPLLLPVGALSTAIDNAAYGQQRAKVKTYISQHAAEMHAERFSGPVTQTLLNTVPEHHRSKVRAEIAALSPSAEFAERATIIVMVHRA